MVAFLLKMLTGSCLVVMGKATEAFCNASVIKCVLLSVKRQAVAQRATYKIYIRIIQFLPTLCFEYEHSVHFYGAT